MSSSWSWFPFNFSFHYLTPPLSIQRRFISFILKRSLGHLLKPGQFDVSQIDAQIGNGYVEVKDLELNEEAINAFVTGTPFRLQSGRIGTATARIPWPNPFSSTIGLSISGLDLMFTVTDARRASSPKDYASELVESVATVADTFMHEELSRREEVLLRESIHPDLPSTFRSESSYSRPPGSLEPFEDNDRLRTTTQTSDPEGISIFAGLFERLLARFDFDTSNMRISIRNPDSSEITLHLASVSYVTETPDESRVEHASGEARSVRIEGLKVTVRDLHPTVSPTSISSPLIQTPTKSRSTSVRESSDSEMDEETQLMMSQSIVTLPPQLGREQARASSPAISTISSATSSMYQSAVDESTLPSRPGTPQQESFVEPSEPLLRKEHTILAFAEPIVIRLLTPPPYVPPASSSSPSDPGPLRSSETEGQVSEKMKLHFSSGAIATALHAMDIRCLLELANTLSVRSSPPPTRKSKSDDGSAHALALLDRLDCSLHVNGIIILALGSADSDVGFPAERFFSRPLTPPRYSNGYVRLHIDCLEASASASQQTSNLSSRDHSTTPSSADSLSTTAFASCTMSDISVLAFYTPNVSHNQGLDATRTRISASPVLIFDPNLASSYQDMQATSSLRGPRHPNSHSHPFTDTDKEMPLPSLDIVDWTSSKFHSHGASLRTWRTRPREDPSHHRKISDGLNFVSSSNFGASSLPRKAAVGLSPKLPTAHLVSTSPSLRQPAIPSSSRPVANPALNVVVSFKEPAGKDVAIGLNLSPVHVFVGLQAAEAVLGFLDEALPPSLTPPFIESQPAFWNENISPRDKYDQLHHIDEDGTYLAATTPSSPVDERKRLEKLVLDDLKLGLDYRQHGRDNKSGRPPTRPSRNEKEGTSDFKVHLPLLRIEVRVPPPLGRQPRSGALVLDVHSLYISSAASLGSSQQSSLRFQEPDTGTAALKDWFGDANGVPIASLELQRVFIAYASVEDTQARGLLSLGPFYEPGTSHSDDRDELPPLLPLIIVRQSNKSQISQKSSTAVLIRVPSLCAVISKPVLDGLQMWADDVSQWAEKMFGSNKSASGTVTNASVTRNSSLIGSRFFVKRAGSGSTESDFASTVTPESSKSEGVLQIIVSEVFLRSLIPVGESGGQKPIRYLDICAADLDALIELSPEGKDETAITLSISDMSVSETYESRAHSLVARSSLSISKRKVPALKLRFLAKTLSGTLAKESKVKLALHGLRIQIHSDMEWLEDLGRFVKAPPGVFEAVVPSERTGISVSISECALRLTPPSQPSALTLSLGDVALSTDLIGSSPETALTLNVTSLSLLLIDDCSALPREPSPLPESDCEYWQEMGYAILLSVADLDLRLRSDNSNSPPDVRVAIDGVNLYLYLCADSIAGIVAFITDMQTLVVKPVEETHAPEKAHRRPAVVSVSSTQSSTILRSLDEDAFRRPPVIGPLPDMMNDDLPTNPEYLDFSFGAAAGLRPIDDDDDEFYPEDDSAPASTVGNVISKHGGETIKMLVPSIDFIENFYDAMAPSSVDYASEHGDTSFKVRAQNCNINLLLFEGYDWERTRRTIQEEAKRVKKRLAKIRQLLANGQAYDPNVDEINTILFDSVYVGLDQDAESLEPDAMIAAIDEELNDDSDAATESSWQSFKPRTPSKPHTQKGALRAKRLTRSRAASIEFSLQGLDLEFDQYRPDADLASRLLFTIRDLEILDHIKTSTWSKFLTSMRSDSRGNVRETDSDMVRVELQMLLPYHGHPEQEARLKAKLLPLRLHVDQDALDFLKKFFSFKDPDASPSPPPENEIFFQHVEIFPIDLKLDYKPRRVDYRALKEGKTIELMNFFHFDGAEMTLRHITLKGMTGWPRMFDTLNDLWTPDVKANQLVDVISGVSPIRSAVNVGSGVADLILLPIAQYKKDGRIIRGLQKGTNAFVKTTAIEAIKLGARLATGTQVVLEHAETVLGGQFQGSITTEAMGTPMTDDGAEEDEDGVDLISKYAEQPTNIKEGVQSAYKTLSHNMKSAGQTILAVPMEVYERSGKEGPARAVIRAVPIAVLKPMIGASEAISKTLHGLRGSLEPASRLDSAAKYKHR